MTAGEQHSQQRPTWPAELKGLGVVQPHFGLALWSSGAYKGIGFNTNCFLSGMNQGFIQVIIFTEMSIPIIQE